jgi:hypothetical protein
MEYKYELAAEDYKNAESRLRNGVAQLIAAFERDTRLILDKDHISDVTGILSDAIDDATGPVLKELENEEVARAVRSNSVSRYFRRPSL